MRHCLSIASAIVFASTVYAQLGPVDTFSVNREGYYRQTGPFDVQSEAFGFSSFVEPSFLTSLEEVTGAYIGLPVDGSFNYVPMTDYDGYFGYLDFDYVSRNALYEAYPNDIYDVEVVIDIEGSPTFHFAGLELRSILPSVPRFTNFDGTSFGEAGYATVNTDEGIGFSWNALLDMTPGDFVRFELYDMTSETLLVDQTFQAGPGPIPGQVLELSTLDGITATGTFIPSDYFSYGSMYQATLQFNELSDQNVTSIPGAFGVANNISFNELTFEAVPEPSTYLMFGLGGAAAFWFLRRRARRS